MKVSRRTFSKGCATLAGAMMLPSWASADAPQALDGALPVEITTPGSYILNSNQTVNLTDTPAILISCDDVEIDLQGYRIENTYGNATSSVGVGAKNCNRVRVKNGELRGFFAAVMLEDTDGGTYGHRIEQITASNCKACGFMLSGNGCVVSGNTITNPGGTNLFRPSGICSASMGIAVIRSLGCLITGNSLSFTDGGSTNGTVGIFTHWFTKDAVILDNSITGADYGIVFGGSTGEYRDNVVNSTFLRPYASGTDIGNNL